MDDGSLAEKRGLLTGLLPAVALLLLLAAYPLSLGPAIVLHRSTTSPIVHSAIETFYFPLEWIHENTPLREPLNWYVDLWQG